MNIFSEKSFLSSNNNIGLKIISNKLYIENYYEAIKS